MNINNRISVFASSATAATKETHATDTGYYYEDSTWAGLPDRKNGAKEGVAYSINYNTAIRQATVMASVLADILATRNEQSNAYTLMSTNGIGATFSPSEVDMDSHISNLANIMSSTNMLMNNEVTTNKINAKAVTTEKIADNAITQLQLGSILGNNSIESTANGVKVRLFQDNSLGKLNLEVTGNSVTNSDNANITAENSARTYITGSNNTSGYNSLKVNSNVYSQSGSMYANVFSAKNYITAPYFNATSDIRKKSDIERYIDYKTIAELVENTDIVTFKYTGSEETNIGVIAQEIDKSINGFNLVTLGEDGYLQVRENKIVYILWNYIQQLNWRLNHLTNRVRELEIKE